MALKIESGSLTDVGKVRKQNEDFVLARPDLGLFIVCDGVGGHLGGQVASETAAKVIEREIEKDLPSIEELRKSTKELALGTSDIERVERILISAIRAACTEVHQKSEKDMKLRGMATTADVGLVIGNHLVIGHVGDGRIYLMRSKKCHRLTEDHSVASDLAKQGVIQLKDVPVSPFAHVLSRAVGFEDAVHVDTLAVEMMGDDFVFLCSDGLHDYFEDNEFVPFFSKPNIENISKGLIDAAKGKGGKDNISVVVLKAVEVLEAAPGAGKATESQPTVSPDLKVEVLKTIPLFQHLTFAEIARVLQVSYQVHFTQGQVFIEEDHKGSDLLVTLNGKVEVFKKGVHLVFRDKGCVIGEMGLIDLAPRSASVKAVDEVDALVIPRERLFQLLRRESRLAVKILWALCHGLNARLRETTVKLVELENELQARQRQSTGGDVPFTS